MSNARPFSSGTQYADWEAGNCPNCIRGDQQNPNADYVWGRCDIRDALSRAFMGSGEVSEEIWQRMGGPANEGALGWWCPERRVWL